MENRLIGDQGPSRIWVRLFEGGSRIARQAQMDPRTHQQLACLELWPRILQTRAGVCFAV